MKQPSKHRLFVVVFSLAALLLLTGCTVSGQSDGAATTLTLQPPAAAQSGAAPGGLTNTVQILVMLTALAFIPALLIIMTGFVRIVVVLSVLRSAIGIPQLPPNQVVIGLALILTFFVMSPVLTQVNDNALQPYLAGKLDQQTAVDKGMVPLREFMFRQVRQEDLSLFLNMADLPRPNTHADVPSRVLIPAFLISELRTAFQMAFVIYVPFLVIDMVVSSALLSMGMMMLPPTVVSLPFKLLLFVLVNGWHLLAQSLVTSFS
jgi:flagellar biosynthetic protein FliP